MSETYTFDSTILREYDIRGIVNKTLSADDARAVGRAFGTVIARKGGKVVAVGYDGRTSSPELEAALVEGLVAAGMTVHRIGLGPTPMLYFAVRHLEADGGVMITGSHNPPEYNGIKMTLTKAPVYGEQIQELGRIAADGAFASGEGRAESLDVSAEYLDRLVADYIGGKELKVVWDTGNGSTGDILKRLVARLPGEHKLLFADIDGQFPNHHPDPTIPENLTDLIETVRRDGCDLGIAFDGDGDRIGAVDEHGRIVWGDQLLSVYAREVLADHPGGVIISDVKASQTLFDAIADMGGTPLMWKTGHSLIKAKMAETASPLAGEMSGHIFFADKYYGFDDALYCGMRLVSLLARSDLTLGQMRDRLPEVHNTPEMRFQVDESRKFPVIEEVKERLAANPDADVNDVDGVRVKTEDGWWLMRASNTQDVLVARAEAFTPEGLARLKTLLADQLTESGITPPPELRGG